MQTNEVHFISEIQKMNFTANWDLGILVNVYYYLNFKPLGYQFIGIIKNVVGSTMYYQGCFKKIS